MAVLLDVRARRRLGPWRFKLSMIVDNFAHEFNAHSMTP